MNKKTLLCLMIMFVILSVVNVFGLSVSTYYTFEDRNYTFYVNVSGSDATYTCNFKLFDNSNNERKNITNSSVKNATLWSIYVGFLDPQYNNYTYFVNCSNSTDYNTSSETFEVNHSVVVHFTEKIFNVIVDKEYTYNLSDSTAFNITDKENDPLIFSLVEANASLNVNLNGNILTIKPNSTGSFEAKINVSDDLEPRLWKQFVLKFNVDEGFNINVHNNNEIFYTFYYPTNISVRFNVTGVWDNYTCELNGSTFTVDNNTEITRYIEVNAPGNYQFTLKCQHGNARKSVNLNYQVQTKDAFVIQSKNNNTQFALESVPNQIPIAFRVIAYANYDEFSCNITGDALESLNVNNATLNTIYVNVSSYRTYHYTITCWPLAKQDDVKSINVQYKVKEVEAKLSYPSGIILNEDEEKERGETAKTTFTIKNTGTIGLNIKLIIHNQYIEIEGHNDTYEFYLDPDESKTLDVESEIRYDYDSGVIDLDTIDIKYVNETRGYEGNYDMKIKMYVPSLLKLDAFSVEADKTNDEVVCSSYSSCFTKEKNVYEMKSSSKYVEIEPNDDIRFKIRVEAESFDMKDVYATLEIDDWDVDEESEEYDIDSNDDKTFTFNIKAPLRIEEDDEIEYKITIEGKDKVTRARQKITIYGKMIVTKEKNQVYVENLELNPEEITCYDITYLTARILNIGRNDLDIKYEIKGLNFDYQYSDECELQEYDGSDDDYCDINLAINVPTSEETEIYKISFVVKDEDDNIINGPFVLNLKRNPCEEKPSEKKEEKSTEIILTNESTEVPTVYLPEKSSGINEETLLLGAVVVLSAATIGMIFVLIKLLI